MLAALARSSPVVVGIDDVHWLDHASQGVLAFARRRLRNERIGLLLARRTDTGSAFPGDAEDDARMPVARLRLSALDADQLEGLLRRHLGGGLERRWMARIHHSSGGNPLFALQLGRAMLQGDVVDDAGVGVLIPATLQQVVADQLLALSPAALEVVQAAAAVARPTMVLIESVVANGRASEGVAAASAAGVLVVDRDRVWFTHPLLASAAYTQMSPSDRRQLHARLAAVSDDVEERGRHLAAAAERPGAEVAAALDAAAQRARARCAPDAAAELWEAAARFTPADQAPAQWERLLHAADCLFESRRGGARPESCWRTSRVQASPGPTRARSLVRLGWVVAHIEGFEAGADAFQQALDGLGDDVTAKVEVEEGLAWCLHSSSGLAAAEPHAHRALALAEGSGDPQLVARALTHIEFLGSLAGRGLAVEAVGQVAGTADSSWPEILVRPDWLHGMLLEWDDHLVAARERFATLHRAATDRGDEHSLPFILFHLARTQLLSGDWTQALQSARECSETTRSSGQASERPYACTIEALVEAHLGAVDAASARIAEGIELADRFGVVPARLEMLATRGFLELSLGRNDDADRTLTDLATAAEESGLLEPALFRYHGDAIEAKIALGRLDESTVLVDRIEELAATLQRPLLAVVAGRGRGLLQAAGAGSTTPATDSPLCSPGIAQGNRSSGPVRSWRSDPCSVATAARAAPALRWSRPTTRSSASARRCGSTRPLASWPGWGAARPSAGLTPTELQVAELIAAGRTYREVAAELFISPKTVQWNLSKVYRKLDIRSRAELPGRLEPR